MKEYLAGFDAREIDKSNKYNMAQLKADSEEFLTVDTMIWRTIFDQDVWSKLPTEKSLRQHTWRHLPELYKALENRTEQYYLIAITRIENEDEDLSLKYLETTPNVITDKWTLLGYDVASDSLLSGLTNVGFDADQFQALQTTYSDKINKYHLFKSPESAKLFAEWARNSPEHKTHDTIYIFGLYEINL